jgi:hypothetical protein
MTVWGVAEDGTEFEITNPSLVSGSVWVNGAEVSNIYVSIMASYSVFGFTIDEDHPLTIDATVLIVDWRVNDPNNPYAVLQSATVQSPPYDPFGDSALIGRTSTTTLLTEQTDLEVGRVYLAPEEGYQSFSIGLGNDFDSSILWLFAYLHGLGSSTIGRTMWIQFQGRVVVQGSVQTVDGWVADTVSSGWSSEYTIQFDLSASEGAGGTASVQLGSFSLEGGSQSVFLPQLLMLVGGGGLFVTLIAAPVFESKMR